MTNGAETAVEAFTRLMEVVGEAQKALREEAAVDQGWLRRDVAQVSGIPYGELRDLPYREWAEVRARYCGNNNRLLPEYAKIATEIGKESRKGA